MSDEMKLPFDASITVSVEALRNCENVEYIPLVVRCDKPWNWTITVNADLTVNKPEGMTEGEALILAALFSSNIPGQHCPVSKAVLEKWAPFWGKPVTIETENLK